MEFRCVEVKSVQSRSTLKQITDMEWAEHSIHMDGQGLSDLQKGWFDQMLFGSSIYTWIIKLIHLSIIVEKTERHY